MSLLSRHALRIVTGVLGFGLLVGVASAFWTTGSAPGGHGASVATTVNQGSTPSATASGRSVAVDWARSTMSNGDPASGYVVTRYDAATLTPQTVGSGCTGIVTASSCTEAGLPAGRWVYSVTPVVATNWRGLESVKSNPVTMAAPTLSLSSSRVQPGGSLIGTVDRFLAGETLRYRIDNPTGTELNGTLSGNATPAAVPTGGSGSVSVTVPAGTSDGPHTVYAVTSPSGDVAAADIVVDGTAPPAPVLTVTPTAVSGDSVTFAYTEAEVSATVECRLDTAAFGPCDSPIDYAGLTAGSHTFQARATDTVGNVSAPTSYTWTVNLSVPTIAIGSPNQAGSYNDAGFTASCGTAATGDVCGTAEDDSAVDAVSVSLRRSSTGLYWDGSAFAAATETWQIATGNTDWTYGIASTALPEGDFTLRARASDGSNLGYDSRTFTVDRTPPAAPTLTSVPPPTTGPAATVTFTTTDPTAGFECRLDGGTWAPCSSPKGYSGLANGPHTMDVRAVDGAGNTSSNRSTSWTVDATPPVVAASFPTATPLNLAGWAAGCSTPATGDICGTASDTGSGLTAVAVSIRRASTNSYWDGSAFAASSQTWLTATGTTSWSYAFAGANFPADGSYTVSWRATDAAGNTTIGSTAVTLDTTPPPAPQIVQAPNNPSGSTAQFDFIAAESGASLECRLDSGAWTTCTAPVTYSGLAAGGHTFAVRATDSAGNISTPTTYAWTVDVGLPNVSIGFPDGGRSYNDSSYATGCGTPAGDICGTASDPQGAVAGVAVSIQRASTSLYWNGTSFSSPTEVFLPATGTSSWSYAMSAASFPGEGGYTLRARANDNVGLTSIDAVTITIDRTPPAAPTITSGPTGTTSGGDTFAFSGAAGARFECRLDAGTWQTCTSPRTYGGLSDALHTFDVRAVDQAGNTGTAASRSWTVDATAPNIATAFPATGGIYTTTTYNAGCAPTTGEICGTTSDTPSGVAKVEFSLQRASTGLYLSGTTLSADGTYTLTVRATDTVGNTRTSSRSFVVDRTKPTGTGFTTTNALIARKLDAGDTFKLTYSESVAPGSIIAGWNGAGPQTVVVRATGTGGRKDTLSVYNSTNTTLLPLGTVNLKRTDYVTAAMTFGNALIPSTMTMSGSTLTITLGQPSGVPTIAAGAANVTWTPASGVTDLAGNPASTTAYTENDLDNDF